MSIRDNIEEALSRSVCGGWDREFLESILEQLSKGRDLSIKQKQALGKVLSRNTEEDQHAHESWADTYKDEYREAALVLAAYHERQPYYKPMATDILKGRVPERGKFLRMYDNKYSKKVLLQHSAVPKYGVGDYVRTRAAFNSYKNVEFPADMVWSEQNKIIQNLMKRGAFVIEVCNKIHSAAKGAKRYRLLPVGSTIPLIVEERFLKKIKTA